MSAREQEIQDTVGFFEQILQSNPDDVMTLEVLADAYEQMGQSDKARETWRHLAECVVRNRDAEKAKTARARIEPYISDPAIGALARMLESQYGVAAPVAAPEEAAEPEEAAHGDIITDPLRMKSAAAYEAISLAREFVDGRFITEAEYDQMTNDIQAAAAGPEIPKLPITALCALHAMHPEKTDDAVQYLAERYLITPIRVNLFTIPQELKAKLPVQHVRIRGCFPFAQLDDTLQIAIMNPADMRLRQEIETLSGMKCNFFLTHPADLSLTVVEFPVDTYSA